MTMTVAGVSQLDPPHPSSPGDCGAASAARAANYAKNASYGASYLRTKSGRPYTQQFPGLYSSDIVKALDGVGVPSQTVAPSSLAELRDRTANGEMALLLGDYSAMNGTAFEISKTFEGDHWATVDHYANGTYDWADSVRRPDGFKPMRIPETLIARYWLKPPSSKIGPGRAIYVRGADFVEDYMITIDEKQNLVLPEGTPYYDSVLAPTPLGTIFVPGAGVEYGSIARVGWRAIRIRTAKVPGGPVWAYVRTGVGKFVPKPPPPATGGGFTQAQLDAALAEARAEEQAKTTDAIATNTADLRARAAIGVVAAVQEAIASL